MDSGVYRLIFRWRRGNTISVTQTNHCGETGPATDVTFTADSCYDVPAPEAPVILSPAYGEILDTPLVLIQGKAEPNASIRICFEDDCYNVTADDLGVWMFQLTSPLEDGTYQISATQTNECGKTSPPTKSLFTIVIPVCPTPPVPNITAPAPEETVYDMQPFILGSAEPGNTVTVCVDSICVVTVADENGEWSVQSPQELAIGSHMVTAHQENECGASSLTVEQLFSVAVPVNELAITELVRGQTFRTVDATLEIGQMSGPWTVYYLLLDPELPAPTEAQVIRYNDPVTLTTGQAARGVFLQPQQGNVTLMRVLPGREVPSPLPGETGVMDGQRYILYMVGVVSTGVTTGQVYSAVTAIGMPFDSGEGTPAQPFIVRELTGEDLTGYPDLNSSHPANRAGVNETARQLDNIEGMRVLYDQNKQNGILNSLALFYELQSDFDLENYAGAYGGNGWRPIGNFDATHYDSALASHYFSGTLTGNAHTVYNLIMSPTGQAEVRWVQFVGFIGYALGATVRDLTILGALITPTPVLPAASGYAMRTAVLCAYARNSTLIGDTVASGAMTIDFGTGATTYVEVGGIVGELIGSTVQNIRVQSLSYSDSSSVTTYFGGFAGYAHNDSSAQTLSGIILDDVRCIQFAGNNLYAGGMVGYYNAINALTVQTVTSTNVHLQTARAFLGGVIGYLRVAATTTFSDITVTGPVIYTQVGGYYSGGVIGYISALQSLNMSSLTVSDADMRAEYASAGMVGWINVQDGAAIDIGDFTVQAKVSVNTSYAGGPSAKSEDIRPPPFIFTTVRCWPEAWLQARATPAASSET